MITFIVPGQPQGKGRPRIGRAGQHARMFTPAKTVAYEGLIAHAAQQAMAGRPLFDGPVHVTLAVACQVPASWSKKKRDQALDARDLFPTTKPDIDNVVKAVFDGMNGVVWRDDVQCVNLLVSKQYREVPCVRVTVQRWTAEA